MPRIQFSYLHPYNIEDSQTFSRCMHACSIENSEHNHTLYEATHPSPDARILAHR